MGRARKTTSEQKRKIALGKKLHRCNFMKKPDTPWEGMPG